MQARTQLVGHARLYKAVFHKGFWDEADLRWLAEHRGLFVALRKDHAAVIIDAQVQAAASGGMTVGHLRPGARRGHSA
jgi:hypothetical protein